MGNQKQSLTPPRSLTPLRLRFGPVEDRRNNHRLVTITCVIWILQIWWLSPLARRAPAPPDPMPPRKAISGARQSGYWIV